MKRFTVMLPEDVIILIKRAKYSPTKKRVIIEAILKDIFYQLEGMDYPERIYISAKLEGYKYDSK